MNEEIGAAKQVMNLQKTAIDGFMMGVLMLFNQTEAMLSTLFSLNPWLPNQSKNALTFWLDYNRKSLEGLKDFVDLGFSNLETGYAGMKMMGSVSSAAGSAGSALEEVVNATPIKTATDLMLGQQEQPEQPEQMH